MRLHQLTENKDYNDAKKIKPLLSRDAERALNSWEFSNWDSGELSNHFENNTAIAQELITAFEPVRNNMRKRYGNTIKLYRGIDEYATGVRDDRLLFSWTIDPAIAKEFAGQNRNKQKAALKKVPDDTAVNAAIERFHKTGFTSFLGYKYILNKNNPKYYDIYRGKSYQTDGDNIERELFRQRDYMKQRTKDYSNIPGQVIEKNIPIDDIIWVLMGGNAQEYIVKGHAE